MKDRLAETQPHPVPLSVRMLPMAAIGLALAFALFGPPLLGTLAPWIALGGVAAAAVWRARRDRRLSAAVDTAEELLRRRDPQAAFTAADALLPELVHEPGPSARCVHVMARALQQLGHPESCLVVAETLLDRLPPHHPARAGVLLNRAIAEFESDRLADGDATLGRLRAMIDLRQGPPGAQEREAATEADGESEKNSAAGPAEEASATANPERRRGLPLPAPDQEALEQNAAAFRVARLIQSAMTWHVADAIADAEKAGGPVAAFRALGIDAGFAHGLLAWCHLQLEAPEAAATAWARATRLVPASALTHRFPRLQEAANTLPSSGPLPA